MSLISFNKGKKSNQKKLLKKYKFTEFSEEENQEQEEREFEEGNKRKVKVKKANKMSKKKMHSTRDIFKNKGKFDTKSILNTSNNRNPIKNKSLFNKKTNSVSKFNKSKQKIFLKQKTEAKKKLHLKKQEMKLKNITVLSPILSVTYLNKNRKKFDFEAKEKEKFKRKSSKVKTLNMIKLNQQSKKMLNPPNSKNHSLENKTSKRKFDSLSRKKMRLNKSHKTINKSNSPDTKINQTPNSKSYRDLSKVKDINLSSSKSISRQKLIKNLFKKGTNSTPKRNTSKSCKKVTSNDSKKVKNQKIKKNSYKLNSKKSISTKESFQNIANDQCEIERNPEKYLILHCLIGKGSFGEVYLVQNRLNHQFYAMKILNKMTLHENDMMRYAFTEKQVMAHIDHPYIVKLRYAFQNKNYLYLFMDYMPGGNLSERIERGIHFICNITNHDRSSD
jgi:hypothetical protein